jgi:hypothetical protein
MSGRSIELDQGDWVTTHNGQIGEVVHISRMTVFVAFSNNEKSDTVAAFLESELTKIDPPAELEK